MLKGLLAVALSLRRIAAQLAACARELKRIGDLIELQASGRGGFRSFYRDDKPNAVEDARLFHQSDADMAALEQAEDRMRRAGREPGLDEEI